MKLDTIIEPDFTRPGFTGERWAGWDETLMSNIDDGVDDGAEEHLKSGGWGRHAGWRFNGIVWFEQGKFFETVSCYQVRQATFCADSLIGLKREVNEEFGYY